MTQVVLTKSGAAAALLKLAKLGTPDANALYVRIMNNWGIRHDRTFATMRVRPEEEELLSSLKLPPTLVECVRWKAIYQDPKNSDNEVTVTSYDKPPKRRTLSTGSGRIKLVRTELTELNYNPEGDRKMATKKRRTKKTEADIDELEGLEELDELEDLEEPDVEEDEEVEEKPKRSTRSRRKKSEPEPEDDDDEEDEDEEDGEPAPKRRKRTSKAKSKAASTKKKPTPPAQRELPKGKVGPNEVADLAGVEARDVRAYLRRNDIEKDEELGRYAFTKTEAKKLAAAIKKAKS